MSLIRIRAITMYSEGICGLKQELNCPFKSHVNVQSVMNSTEFELPIQGFGNV